MFGTDPRAFSRAMGLPEQAGPALWSLYQTPIQAPSRALPPQRKASPVDYEPNPFNLPPELQLGPFQPPDQAMGGMMPPGMDPSMGMPPEMGGPPPGIPPELLMMLMQAGVGAQGGPGQFDPSMLPPFLGGGGPPQQPPPRGRGR